MFRRLSITGKESISWYSLPISPSHLGQTLCLKGTSASESAKKPHWQQTQLPTASAATGGAARPSFSPACFRHAPPFAIAC